tara:strand:+ start:11942 stop:12337 length:396 start_codon:yes stop_codon:yes gene_type:complete
MSEKRKVIVDDEEYNVELEKKGSSWKVKIRNREFTVKIEGDKNKSIKENKKRKKTKIGNGTISSSIPGKIISVNIDIGDLVNEGDVLVILEAMKMQNEIVSPIKGIVKNINCKTGDSIDANVPLIIVEDKT